MRQVEVPKMTKMNKVAHVELRRCHCFEQRMLAIGQMIPIGSEQEEDHGIHNDQGLRIDRLTKSLSVRESSIFTESNLSRSLMSNGSSLPTSLNKRWRVNSFPLANKSFNLSKEPDSIGREDEKQPMSSDDFLLSLNRPLVFSSERRERLRLAKTDGGRV